MRLREIRLQLPEHLAKWLEEFSKQVAMTPSQLMANILSYYYEAWRIGRDSAHMGETTETGPGKVGSDLERKAEQFLSGSKGVVDAFIVRSFISWLLSRGLDLKDVNESLIEQFLEEYSLSRKVKSSTKRTYRNTLRKFLNFVKGSLEHSSPKPPT